MGYFIRNHMLTVLMVSLLLYQCQPDPSRSKPNIIVVLADDLGWADVGYNGALFYETPNIDKLAREGMVFNRFYPSAANCAPSRASIMTGMYSPRHGVYLPQGLSKGKAENMRWKVPTHGQDASFNTFPVSINHVDPEFESLAELVKKGGYVTGRFGKWHIGDDNQGFDVSSSDGTPGFVTNRAGLETRFYDDTTVAQRLTHAAIDFIARHRTSPFFVFLSHWEVHSPMAATQDRVAYYAQKPRETGAKDYGPVYAAEVEQVDVSLGKVMEALDSLNLAENTLLIFTSDNGGSLKYTTNAPLREGKGTFYEGGIRVPFLARWPAVIRPGSHTNVPVSGIDFMPTFAEIAGVPKPQNQPVDGLSILPVFREEQFSADRTLFFHFPLYLSGQKDVSRALPVYNSDELFWRAVPSTTLIKGDWKMIYYYEYDNYELFNLEVDVSERNNLAEQYPEIERALLKEIHEWVNETNAPLPNVPASQ
jgi:arylsulfatase A-like enzyme